MANKGNRKKQKRISYHGKVRIFRKDNIWTYSTNAGAHPKDMAVSLGLLLRDVLHFAENTREVKYILRNKNVLVNTRKYNDYKYPLGLFDIIEFKDINKTYKLLLDDNGFVKLKELEKKDLKTITRMCRVVGKNILDSKKIQLNLDNGFNVLVNEDKYKLKDSVLLDLKTRKILSVHPFKKGAEVFIFKGPHVGKEGVLKEIIKGTVVKNEEVIVDVNGKDLRTRSDYIFVITKN